MKTCNRHGPEPHPYCEECGPAACHEDYDQWKNDILRGWPMNLDTVELQRRDYRTRIEIDRRQYETLRGRAILEDMLDRATGNLIREAQFHIYGKDHPERHVIRFPSNWWEAVKERFAPAWFLDIYPVVFTEINASLQENYPDIEPALPDRAPVLRFTVRRGLTDRYCW